MRSTDSSSGPALQLSEIRKTYFGTEVLRGVDLTVESGDVLAILGPSGSGKSTMLRTINHLTPADSGAVGLYGDSFEYPQHRLLSRSVKRRIEARRRRIGMVFQHFNLFGHLSALENVTLGPVQALGLSKDEASERARILLDKVGLAAKANNRPSQLSGGQQQRVAIARALAMEPDILLLDEPTSALDPELVGEVLTVIGDLAKNTGVTMLITTHEVAFARDVADQALIMADGAIVEQGAASDVLHKPTTARAQAFLSRVTSA